MKRKIYKLFSSTQQVLSALALTVFSGVVHSQATYTFNYTGAAQTLAIPAGNFEIKCWGADGGLGGGTTQQVGTDGKGGYSIGNYSISAPGTIYIYVGGKGQSTNGSGAGMITALGGWNGGGGGYSGSSGTYYKGGGGGGTDVRTSLNTTYANRVIVAGGGGGGGGAASTPYVGSGGFGGGTLGQDGILGTSQTTHNGKGGSQTAGGAGGVYASTSIGANGGFGPGGDGGSITGNVYPAGGGGGGWYGGGGGATQGGSGGGGSGYIGGVTSATTIMSGQPGFVTNPVVGGDGLVIIRELCSISIFVSGNSSTLTPMICSGQSLTLTTNAVSNYSWSTGATSNSIVVAPNTNTVYSLVGTSSLNCSTSASRSINVNSAAPVLSISNPSTNICLGRTVTLTASGALTYTWTNPGVVNGQTFTPSTTQVYTVSGENGCGITTATTAITVAPLPVTASANPTLVCEGYAATLTANSAVNGYTWQPGPLTTSMVIVGPTVATIYTVTASDGICSGTQTVLLTTKTTPVITPSQTFVTICNGESILLTAGGAGTGGTYSWSPGGAGQSITLTPPTSTNVQVFGTNSLGCTASNQQIIIVATGPPLTVTANKTAICTGDQAVLTATGAAGYQWTSGPGANVYSVSPTSPVNVYTVTGSQSSNTCTTVKTITVSVVTPNVSHSSSLATCDGSGVTFTASGATSYTWNTVVSPTGVYQTTPTANGVYTLYANTSSMNINCMTTGFATVTLNAHPNLTVTAGKQTICKGETHTLTVTGASTYSWGAAGSGSVITVKPTLTTLYTVVGIDANGCDGSTIYTAKVNSCNGIEEVSGAQSISVYPNPNNGEFMVATQLDITLKVVNGIGQEVRTITLNSDNNHKAEIKDLSSGLYFIVGENAEGKVNQKIIVTK